MQKIDKVGDGSGVGFFSKAMSFLSDYLPETVMVVIIGSSLVLLSQSAFTNVTNDKGMVVSLVLGFVALVIWFSVYFRHTQRSGRTEFCLSYVLVSVGVLLFQFFCYHLSPELRVGSVALVTDKTGAVIDRLDGATIGKKWFIKSAGFSMRGQYFSEKRLTLRLRSYYNGYPGEYTLACVLQPNKEVLLTLPNFTGSSQVSQEELEKKIHQTLEELSVKDPKSVVFYEEAVKIVRKKIKGLTSPDNCYKVVGVGPSEQVSLFFTHEVVNFSD